jgi:hypothetical protein
VEGMREKREIETRERRRKERKERGKASLSIQLYSNWLSWQGKHMFILRKQVI